MAVRLVLVVVALILLSPAVSAGVSESVHRQLEAVPDDIDRLLQELNRSWGDAVPDLSLAVIVGRILRRETPVDFAALPASVASHLGREVFAVWRLAAQLVGIGLVMALLSTLSPGQDDGPVRVARLVCHLSLVKISIGAFMIGLNLAGNVTRDLMHTMLALMPTLAGLVAASGAYATAGLFHPFLLGVVHYTGLVVADFVLPVLMTAGVIELVGFLSPVHKLSAVSALLRQIGYSALGLGMCLVLGVSAVLGAAGMAGDGVALRSMKFAAGTFIPVVGKMFGDAAELVLSSTLIVKNAVGIAGVAALLLTAGLPLLRLIALVIVFRVAAAVTGPLGSDDITSCANAVAGCVTGFAVAAGAVAVMFFIALAALIGATNAATMMR